MTPGRTRVQTSLVVGGCLIDLDDTLIDDTWSMGVASSRTGLSVSVPEIVDLHTQYTLGHRENWRTA